MAAWSAASPHSFRIGITYLNKTPNGSEGTLALGTEFPRLREPAPLYRELAEFGLASYLHRWPGSCGMDTTIYYLP